jgi:hypothetical protein
MEDQLEKSELVLAEERTPVSQSRTASAICEILSDTQRGMLISLLQQSAESAEVMSASIGNAEPTELNAIYRGLTESDLGTQILNVCGADKLCEYFSQNWGLDTVPLNEVRKTFLRLALFLPNDFVVKIARTTSSPEIIENLAKHPSPAVRISLYSNLNIAEREDLLPYLEASIMTKMNYDEDLAQYISTTNSMRLLSMLIDHPSPWVQVCLCKNTIFLKEDPNRLKFLLLEESKEIQNAAVDALCEIMWTHHAGSFRTIVHEFILSCEDRLLHEKILRRFTSEELSKFSTVMIEYIAKCTPYILMTSLFDASLEHPKHQQMVRIVELVSAHQTEALKSSSLPILKVLSSCLERFKLPESVDCFAEVFSSQIGTQEELNTDEIAILRLLSRCPLLTQEHWQKMCIAAQLAKNKNLSRIFLEKLDDPNHVGELPSPLAKLLWGIGLDYEDNKTPVEAQNGSFRFQMLQEAQIIPASLLNEIVQVREWANILLYKPECHHKLNKATSMGFKTVGAGLTSWWARRRAAKASTPKSLSLYSS